MREIKFRIWNPSGNNMLYDIDNVFECLKQQIKFDQSMPDRGFVSAYDHRSEGMVWMQYTGLRDKNGVEIYEGDILCDENKEIKQGKAVSIVKWSKYNACFIMERYNGEVKLFVPGCTNSKDVIGNIHSNPELLK